MSSRPPSPAIRWLSLAAHAVQKSAPPTRGMSGPPPSAALGRSGLQQLIILSRPIKWATRQKSTISSAGRERSLVHQISPYLIRCSNPAATNEEDRFHKLDAIGQHDL